MRPVAGSDHVRVRGTAGCRYRETRNFTSRGSPLGCRGRYRHRVQLLLCQHREHVARVQCGLGAVRTATGSGVSFPALRLDAKETAQHLGRGGDPGDLHPLVTPVRQVRVSRAVVYCRDAQCSETRHIRPAVLAADVTSCGVD